MIQFENNNKAIDFEAWAKKAIELLDEVKPYRGIFYKHRVAELKQALQFVNSPVAFNDQMKPGVTFLEKTRVNSPRKTNLTLVPADRD